MSSYQPGIPTGTVNLDQDYKNIQKNFQQLDTSFGIDHVTFSNQTPQNGYHESIHFNPVSTTTTNPPNNQPLSHSTSPPSLPPLVPGYGQLFSSTINDGVTVDNSLYFLTGNDLLLQLTRNFQPVSSTNGYTFLPGGIIAAWGKKQIILSPGASGTITFPTVSSNPVFSNVFNVFTLVEYNSSVATPSSTSSMTISIDTFTLTKTSFSWFAGGSGGSYRGFYWIALGN